MSTTKTSVTCGLFTCVVVDPHVAAWSSRRLARQRRAGRGLRMPAVGTLMWRRAGPELRVQARTRRQAGSRGRDVQVTGGRRRIWRPLKAGLGSGGHEGQAAERISGDSRGEAAAGQEA